MWKLTDSEWKVLEALSLIHILLRRMKAEGHAIIIITHKLNEVLEISDRVRCV